MQAVLEQKLRDYKPNESVTQLVNHTPILLLVGPTGAGKDSIKERLLETGKFHHIISHTTRAPRINNGVLEKDGQEYHFIDNSTAEKMLDEKTLIEAKLYSGNLYGTSIAEIQAAHDESKIAMTDIEVQGVAEYKAIDPKVMAVFILPPDFQTWQKRLQKRYGEIVDATDYRRRLETALNEIEQLLNTDYYFALINGNLDSALNKINILVADKNSTKSDDSSAREVAKKLALDIKQYLADNV